jgi:hypothetical protein
MSSEVLLITYLWCLKGQLKATARTFSLGRAKAPTEEIW